MLRLDLIDEREEHVVHLITDIVEIWRAEVGVIIDMGLYLRPLDLAASFVEETALLFVGVPAFAHKTGFAAVGVSADCETWLAVDALGTGCLGLG